MFVKDRMTHPPVATSETTPIAEAAEIMRKHSFVRLPVLRGDELVGIITREDLLKVSPSAATTLSMWELNYVLSKLTVKDAMTRNPVTIDSGATLEEAALLMCTKGVGALPVMEKGRLVGVITESDIFEAFIDLMGLRQTGTRMVLDVEDRLGVIADLTEIIKKEGFNIVSLALFHPKPNYGELVVRLDNAAYQPLVRKLTECGYKVVHVASWA